MHKMDMLLGDVASWYRKVTLIHLQESIFLVQTNPKNLWVPHPLVPILVRFAEIIKTHFLPSADGRISGQNFKVAFLFKTMLMKLLSDSETFRYHEGDFLRAASRRTTYVNPLLRSHYANHIIGHE